MPVGHNITRRPFWFAQQGLGRDGRGDINLRSRMLFGPGIFMLRRDEVMFKLRGGVGYQYARYAGGGSRSEPIAQTGWEYAQRLGDWLRLPRDLTR